MSLSPLPSAVSKALTLYDEASERAAIAGSFTPEEAMAARAEHKSARMALIYQIQVAISKGGR